MGNAVSLRLRKIFRSLPEKKSKPRRAENFEIDLINRHHEYKADAALIFENPYLRFSCSVVTPPGNVGCSYGMNETIPFSEGSEYTADGLLSWFEQNVPKGYWETYHWDREFLRRQLSFAMLKIEGKL